MLTLGFRNAGRLAEDCSAVPLQSCGGPNNPEHEGPPLGLPAKSCEWQFCSTPMYSVLVDSSLRARTDVRPLSSYNLRILRTLSDTRFRERRFHCAISLLVSRPGAENPIQFCISYSSSRCRELEILF